jgi:hypothetical protein
MATSKTPQRVKDGARPKFEPASDLVEIAKRSGEFRQHYGPWLGAFLYLRSMNAARPRSLWWVGLLITLVTGATALLQKYIGVLWGG